MTHFRDVVFKMSAEEAEKVYNGPVYARLSWLAQDHAEKETSCGDALAEPLGYAETFRMMDQYDEVAGYVLVGIDEVIGTDENGFKDCLSRKLSTEAISNIKYDLVWGRSKSLLFYVSGITSG